MKQFIKSGFVILLAVSFGAGTALACSQNGTSVFDGFSLFAFCVLLAFTINWIAFIPAFIFQTEKFFDLIGSSTYIMVIVAATYLSPVRDARTFIVITMVLVWAVRLGTFLTKRMLKEGKDGRFDTLKTNFFSYLIVWTLQGLWVSLTLATSLVIITTIVKLPLGFFAIGGVAIWLIGFVIEVVSDAQKSKWRANKENKGKFIDVGLWSKSRHPNYFGEILIWIGVAIIALPVLSGWNYFSLISPVFVTILITYISGVPILEKSADEKWGGMEEYETYKKNTPVLIPKIV